jgi:hypothetical protein
MEVNLYNSTDAECPNDWEGGWRLASFNSRHLNYVHPDEYLLSDNIGMRRKLECNTAFVLSYHEHGQCLWSLGPGPNCPWDTRQVAGILIWEDNDWRPDMEKREADAVNFLKCYTDWANGNVYGFSIEEDGEVVESCDGFFGFDSESMFEEIRAHTKDAKEVKVSGEAEWLANYHDVKVAA